MGKIILFVASSLDGYIAGPDGNLDWLNSIPEPENGDYGYQDLLSRIATVVMGRITYEEVLGFGVDWPYTEYQTYVVTGDPDLQIRTPNTRIINTSDLIPAMETERRSGDKDVWLVGGGQLISLFLNHGLIDEMLLTRVPLILGDGIPLFPGKNRRSDWELVKAESFSTGLINEHYRLRTT